MSTYDKIHEIEASSKAFYTCYVKPFPAEIPKAKFNKFRLYFINIIYDELVDYFDCSYKKQLLVNTLQYAFNVWFEITKNTVIRYELFSFFFTASCFIVLKLVSPHQIKQLKTWAVEHEIDLNFVLWAERLILLSNDGDIYIETPNQIQTLLLEEVIQSNDKALSDLLSDWIEFVLNEYSIYCKYDLLTITLSTLLHVLNARNDIENKNKIIGFIVKAELNDLSVYEECMKDIQMRFDHSEMDEEYEDELAPVLTRANSAESLNQIFMQFDNKNNSSQGGLCETKDVIVCNTEDANIEMDKVDLKTLMP